MMLCFNVNFNHSCNANTTHSNGDGGINATPFTMETDAEKPTIAQKYLLASCESERSMSLKSASTSNFKSSNCWELSCNLISVTIATALLPHFMLLSTLSHNGQPKHWGVEYFWNTTNNLNIDETERIKTDFGAKCEDDNHWV